MPIALTEKNILPDHTVANKQVYASVENMTDGWLHVGYQIRGEVNPVSGLPPLPTYFMGVGDKPFGQELMNKTADDYIELILLRNEIKALPYVPIWDRDKDKHSFLLRIYAYVLNQVTHRQVDPVVRLDRVQMEVQRGATSVKIHRWLPMELLTEDDFQALLRSLASRFNRTLTSDNPSKLPLLAARKHFVNYYRQRAADLPDQLQRKPTPQELHAFCEKQLLEAYDYAIQRYIKTPNEMHRDMVLPGGDRVAPGISEDERMKIQGALSVFVDQAQSNLKAVRSMIDSLFPTTAGETDGPQGAVCSDTPS